MAAAAASPINARLQVSSIPLTSASSSSSSSNRSRSRAASRGGNGRPKPVIKYEDITRERFDVSPEVAVAAGSVLPEDHLEDLLNLPIAPELVPRKARSKASLASTLHTASTAPFPGAASSSQIDLPTNGTSTSNGDGLPETGEIESHANGAAVRPPKRHDSLRRWAQSTPLQPLLAADAAQLNLPINDTSTSMTRTPSDDSRKQYKKASAAPSPPVVNGSGSSSRNSPVTPRKTATLGSASPRRPSATSSNNTGSARMTTRQVSTPLKSSLPPRKTPQSSPRAGRSRSHSASANRLVSSADSPTAKPPWADDNPEYLYKSDLTQPEPESLDFLALQARSRNGQAHVSDEKGKSPERSWDDVIVPAVAKQIRAQQQAALQASTSSRSPGGGVGEAGEPDEDDELLVTEWHTDGTPKKWARIPRKRQKVDNELESSQATDQTTGPRAEAPASSEHNEQDAASPRPESAYPASRSNSAQANSLSVHSLGLDQAHPPPPPTPPFSRFSSTKQSNPNLRHMPSGSGSYRSTGRTEIWQEPNLSSPNTARGQSLFASQQNQAMQTLGRKSELAPEPKPEPNEKAARDEGTHKGGCKCIIM